MRASLTVAVPEPDSEATSASTDLPLADSDAVMSPDAGQSAAFEHLAEIGAGQLELRRDERACRHCSWPRTGR